MQIGWASCERRSLLKAVRCLAFLHPIREQSISRKCLNCLACRTDNKGIHCYRELQDGMLNAWPPEAVSKQIRAYVSKHNIDTVRSSTISGYSSSQLYIR